MQKTPPYPGRKQEPNLAPQNLPQASFSLYKDMPAHIRQLSQECTISGPRQLFPSLREIFASLSRDSEVSTLG